MVRRLYLCLTASFRGYSQSTAQPEPAGGLSFMPHKGGDRLDPSLPMKTMEGDSSSAALNSSRTSFGPSPRYFWISSEPTTRRKVALVLLATALASSVLPVPGSPYRMTPWRPNHPQQPLDWISSLGSLAGNPRLALLPLPRKVDRSRSGVAGKARDPLKSRSLGPRS